MRLDTDLKILFGGVLALLTIASIVSAILSARVRSEAGRATVRNLVARVNAWWVMVAVFAATLLLGPIGTVVLFGLLSFLRPARVHHPRPHPARRPPDAGLELLRRHRRCSTS